MTRKNKYKNSPHVVQHRMGTVFFYGDPGGIRTPDPRLRRAWRRFLGVKIVDGLKGRKPSICADFKRFINILVY